MYYTQSTFLTLPLGNNALTFQERKEIGSDVRVRIPALTKGKLEDLSFACDDICYEYVDEKGRLVSSYGLEELLYISYKGKDIYIVDNHNHAFAMRWRSYRRGALERGSHLLHLDQHSDFADPEQYMEKYFSSETDIQNISQEKIDTYVNEVLTIASFIKPALRSGLCASHEMIMTEYTLLEYDIKKIEKKSSIILDIDLDFRAPEMSIQEYKKTISLVRKIISLPQVGCITLATSPTYIDQEKVMLILQDLFS